MLAAIIRKLPAPAEFCLVVFVCSWWMIYASVTAIANRSWTMTSPAPAHFTGVGVELGEKDHKVIIAQALPNTPAAKAGLSHGLVIQKIDDKPTDGKSLEDCGNLVRGPAGSKVEFELVDTTNNKTNMVELTREGIQATPAKPNATNTSALIVVILEVFGLAVTFWIARTRGWPLESWGFRPSWKLTGAGVLLFLILALAIQAVATFANGISPGMVHKHSISSMSLPVVILFAIINAVFEETLESGYFIQSLQRYGMWSAVLASAFFRAFLHAYHGLAAIIIIFPFGLVFGFIYWKWRRLWPLFIAHVLFDLIAYFPGF
jgi:membrane protease YdiL (CAAX protease family)